MRQMDFFVQESTLLVRSQIDVWTQIWLQILSILGWIMGDKLQAGSNINAKTGRNSLNK